MRSRPWSRGAVAGCTRSPARGTGSASTLTCCGGWFLIWPSVTYVCGPDQFAADIVSAARRLGAAQEQIHQEAFGF
jgi:hypothetical protein